jgi:hypothetical protein
MSSHSIVKTNTKTSPFLEKRDGTDALNPKGPVLKWTLVVLILLFESLGPFTRHGRGGFLPRKLLRPAAHTPKTSLTFVRRRENNLPRVQLIVKLKIWLASLLAPPGELQFLPPHP